MVAFLIENSISITFYSLPILSYPVSSAIVSLYLFFQPSFSSTLSIFLLHFPSFVVFPFMSFPLYFITLFFHFLFILTGLYIALFEDQIAPNLSPTSKNSPVYPAMFSMVVYDGENCRSKTEVNTQLTLLVHTIVTYLKSFPKYQQNVIFCIYVFN